MDAQIANKWIVFRTPVTNRDARRAPDVAGHRQMAIGIPVMITGNKRLMAKQQGNEMAERSKKIAFGAQETLSLAAAIGKHLKLPWRNNNDPNDAVLVNAAYAALESLERDGITFPR